MKPPVPIGVLRKMLKEVQASARDEKPLAVGGARELARALERALVRGGDPAAVRVGDPDGAAVYIYFLGGEPSEIGRASCRERV